MVGLNRRHFCPTNFSGDIAFVDHAFAILSIPLRASSCTKLDRLSHSRPLRILMLPPGPIVSLTYRVPEARRGDLLTFLREAVPLYERPGRIRVGLYESADEPGLYLELVAYADDAARNADQDRVEHDPEMVATLARFRAVVGGPVEVRRMKPVSDLAAPVGVVVEAAAFNDGPAIAALLAEASLPVPDADDAPVRMVVTREEGRLIGCAGWERHGQAALLRSVAVHAEARGRGVGLALVRAALTRVAVEGAREVALLTNDAESFFAKLGFARIDRAALLEAVRASRQVATACCASAVAMHLSLA
jgi:amino-acid N-acetyltransferase